MTVSGPTVEKTGGAVPSLGDLECKECRRVGVGSGELIAHTRIHPKHCNKRNSSVTKKMGWQPMDQKNTIFASRPKKVP